MFNKIRRKFLVFIDPIRKQITYFFALRCINCLKGKLLLEWFDDLGYKWYKCNECGFTVVRDKNDKVSKTY